MSLSLLHIDPPNELSFAFTPETSITSTIELKNNCNQPLAFKIKTTTPASYYVRPSQGILSSNESKTIQVILHPLPSFPQNNKDKFLVNYTPTSLNKDSSPEDLTQFWQSLQKSGNQVTSTKLMVKLISKDAKTSRNRPNKVESVGQGIKHRQNLAKDPSNHVELEDRVRMLLWILSFCLVMGIVLVIFV